MAVQVVLAEALHTLVLVELEQQVKATLEEIVLATFQDGLPAVAEELVE